jgi:hypothetical protein
MPDTSFEMGQGLQVAPTSLGWGGNPELDQLNKTLEAQHYEEHAPVAKALMKATEPTATGEDHLNAANIVKNVSTSDEFRLSDLLGSLMKKDFGGVVKAINGGSDVTKEAYDSNGNRYLKVYNQRVSTANPLGELRRYMTPEGRVLTPQEIQKVGPIATIDEIPMDQQPFFKANQVAAKDVAQTQAKDWLGKQTVGAKALINSGVIRDAANENKQLTKQLLPYSINPATNELLAGANEIKTGSSRNVQAQQEVLNRLAIGKATQSEWEDFKKKNGGINIPFSYHEGSGLTKGSGEKANREDLDQIQTSLQKGAMNESAITAKRDDLLEKARMLAAQGKIENFDLYARYINNQYKIARAMGDIESNGGIGIMQPNLEYQKGDSFSLAHTKAVLDETYADLAEQFGKKVIDVKNRYGNNVPGIGTVENELALDPTVFGRKKSAQSEVEKFLTENAPTLEKLNKQGVNPSLLTQPASQAVAPPEPSVEVKARPIEGSVQPKPSKSEEKKVKRALNELIPKKGK